MHNLQIELKQFTDRIKNAKKIWNSWDGTFHIWQY